MESLRDFDSPGRAVAAAASLQAEASTEDISRLVSLLSDPEFFVREAAAWPLSDLGCVEAIPQMIAAHIAGTAEGHDNDGLNAEMADLVSMNAEGSRRELQEVIASSNAEIRAVADWLLQFASHDV